MCAKKILKLFSILLLIAAVIATSFPAAIVSAKSKNDHKHNTWDDWYKDWYDDWYDNWCDDWCDDECDDSNDNEKAKKYLVLVAQSNGTYKAYDDIAFITSSDKLMVKAKPVATAIGLEYKSYGSYKNNKVISLSLGKDKNVYTKNQKTYYFMDYNSNTKKTSTTKYTADYKQMVHEDYNSVHYATLGTLVKYKYYDTTGVREYLSLGYKGVIVYNKNSAISQLPAVTNVTNLNDNPNDDNDDTNDNGNIITSTVMPILSTSGDIKSVEATYYGAQTSNPLLLDLSTVISTFKAYGLPGDGIYGYGNCDTALTIQAFDINGYSVGSINTNGTEFMLNFPSAVKIIITGTQKNLILDFTPVKPILITAATKLAFNQIGWLYASDGYARQYFVLSEYLKFGFENVTLSNAITHKMLDITATYNPDNANCYQRITAVVKGTREEMTSSLRYVNVQKATKGINNSLVVFQDTGNATLATNYETQLNTMITTLTSTGLNTYFPSTNWNRQLVMKLSDITVNTAYSYIMVDTSTLDLSYFYDYYLHLHEMIHYYEATKLHYGFRFEAWTDGNATTLAKKTLDGMKISYTDTLGYDYFDSMYSTNYSFLTEDNKKNFETYYLNVTGSNAAIIGYHFTTFLQDTYGSDIVYRILQKVYAAGIPTNAGRNSTYDKQFTDCIKSVTSQKVFQLFVDYCVN